MRDLFSRYWWAVLVAFVALILFIRNVRRGKRH
jgi:hypothetical protein